MFVTCDFMNFVPPWYDLGSCLGVSAKYLPIFLPTLPCTLVVFAIAADMAYFLEPISILA